jgi:hypothetical protein
MFVEAKRPIPWTKPQDITYDPDQGLPAFGGWRPAAILLGMCDGSVHAVAPTVPADMLKRWITMSDGEPVQSPWELQRAHPAAQP